MESERTALQRLEAWPRPWDPATELDWGDPVISRRLLREHLDQSHDGATRRATLVTQHLGRLRKLLPQPPARILDVACGPGAYAVAMAEAGFDVTGLDIGPAVLRHARAAARGAGVDHLCRFQRCDVRDEGSPIPRGDFDAALLIYHVLEAFPQVKQVSLLKRLRKVLAPRGTLVVEMRTRPDQPSGRLTAWDVVPSSPLGDKPHVLIADSAFDARTRTFILRETAFIDGRMLMQQTTSKLTTFDRVEALFARGGFRVASVYEGWSRYLANGLSESLLVVARPR